MVPLTLPQSLILYLKKIHVHTSHLCLPNCKAGKRVPINHNMKKQLLTILAISFLILKSASAQSPGDLDDTFSSIGIYTYDFGFHDNLSDVKIQPNDQKIVCTGTALSPGFTGELKVLRFNTDGTPDSSFGTNGVFSFLITSETYGFDSYIRQDGKIIVSGYAAITFGYYDILLLQLNSNGTLDSTFGTNGSTVSSFSPRDDYAQSMTQQADGKIIVSGTITDTINYFPVPTILRYTENGFIDTTFGTNGMVQIPATAGDNELTSVSVQSDGKIVAAGHYSNPLAGFNDFDILLMRVDTNGVLDSTFGNAGVVLTSINGGVDDCFGMEIDDSGNIFAAGFTTLPDSGNTLDMVLLKYNSAGVLDTTFGSAGIVKFNNSDEDVAYDLKIQPDHKIVVGGTSGLSFFGPRPAALWRYMPDGTPDNTFGTNGFVTTYIDSFYQDINSIALQEDGKIVAVAKFSNGSQNDLAVLRYLTDISISVNEINMDDEMFVSPNPISRGSLLNIHFTGNNSSKSRVEMFDVMGNKVAMFNPGIQNAGENIFQINIPESLNSGLYFLIVSDNNILTKQKIIVQ